MQTQKILKPKEKVVIICDYREEEVNRFLKELGAIVNEIALEVGDFICSESRIAIERKSYGDFISSIINGRIFEQAKSLKENFERPIVIIEGWSDRRISESALGAALATLIVDFNLSIIYTRNPRETAKIIYWIAKKEQGEKKKEISFKIGKKPKELRELRERIIATLPGVGKVLSKRLLEYFKNVERIFTASEDELKKVKGVSSSTAKKIRKILTTE
ncbi:MAG: ERCC4 domain-containing protein [Candidatus Aenigmarchaeota archaeon]|nr:ERCC4 domain-containing protein [Candidatus Aenigmarchaeota archaeon]